MTLVQILLEICATQECMLCTCVGYIVNKSRAITLHLLGTDKYETSGAHLHMLVNIPVKFYDSGSNTFGDMQHTRFWDGRSN